MIQAAKGAAQVPGSIFTMICSSSPGAVFSGRREHVPLDATDLGCDRIANFANLVMEQTMQRSPQDDKT